MNLGKLCLTDFDAVMEYRDIAWILFEVKHGNKPVPTGQRIAIERFVKDTQRSGKLAVATVVEHYVDNPARDIYLRDCLVRSVYASGELVWRPPKHPMTARKLLFDYIDYVEAASRGRFF